MSHSVTVAGHSYIKRLEEQFLQGTFPTNFGLAEFSVTFVHRGGARVSTLSTMSEDILKSQPEIIVLQIGGNDFSGTSTNDHIDVSCNIIQLAHRLGAHRSVKAVYIGKLFYRDIHRRFLPSQNHVRRYNEKVDQVNDLLQRSAHTLLRRNIFVRNHKGMVLMRDSILLKDGTHLGTKKLYN